MDFDLSFYIIFALDNDMVYTHHIVLCEPIVTCME
jgi:hypothetical protein